jgi:hypothetical protein
LRKFRFSTATSFRPLYLLEWKEQQMKRFGKMLIATAGFATICAPAIFARDFRDYNHDRDRDRRDRVVVLRREPVRKAVRRYDRRAEAARHEDRFHR